MEFPRSVQKAIDRAIRELEPEKIMIFGSRARGDARSTSDFDFAFFCVKDQAAWHEFAADMIYEPPSLYRIEVLQFEKVPPELQASIMRDGKVVYESVACKSPEAL